MAGEPVPFELRQPGYLKALMEPASLDGYEPKWLAPTHWVGARWMKKAVPRAERWGCKSMVQSQVSK